MKRRLSSLLCAVAVACLGGVLLAQQVSVDFDRSADISRFKTFAWTYGTPVRDDLNHKRIVRAIDEQLVLKGLTRVEATATPDVFVAYHASFERDLQITGFGSGVGPFYGAGRSMSARAQRIIVGTLVVDVMDAASQTIVWRGSAASDVPAAANAEKRDKAVTKAVTRLFKDYPPKPAPTR